MLLSIRCELHEESEPAQGAALMASLEGWLNSAAKRLGWRMVFVSIGEVTSHPGTSAHPKPIFEAVTQMGDVIWYQKQSDRQIGRVFWCQPGLGVPHDRWSLCGADGLSLDASSDSELEAFAYARRS